MPQSVGVRVRLARAISRNVGEKLGRRRKARIDKIETSDFKDNRVH